jgi:hypothetical protein
LSVSLTGKKLSKIGLQLNEIFPQHVIMVVVVVMVVERTRMIINYK